MVLEDYKQTDHELRANRVERFCIPFGVIAERERKVLHV